VFVFKLVSSPRWRLPQPARDWPDGGEGIDPTELTGLARGGIVEARPSPRVGCRAPRQAA
jgi:hypothetical protein